MRFVNRSGQDIEYRLSGGDAAGEIEIQLGIAGELFKTFRLTIRNTLGAKLASERLTTLPLAGVPTLALTIPAQRLPDGTYQVEVVGLSENGAEELIASQELEVERMPWRSRQ